jgi:hypothetical protein
VQKGAGVAPDRTGDLPRSHLSDPAALRAGGRGRALKKRPRALLEKIERAASRANAREAAEAEGREVVEYEAEGAVVR